MRKEDEIVEALAALLKRKNNYRTIEVDNKKQIFIGTTCGYFKNNLNMLFQSAEQDIIVYLKDKESRYIFKENNFFKRFSKSLSDYKILIPLIIFEVKYEEVITHAVRHYSEMARSIKSIFPFCRYNLLLININIPKKIDSDKIYMAAKNFDKVIYMSNYSLKNENHSKLVNKMWDSIEEHIEYLKQEEYFRLKKFL